MKKMILLVGMLLGLVISGCGLVNSRYLQYEPPCQEVTTTSVGSTMMQIEEQCKNDVYGNIYASFTQQLIYAGKIGTTIRITYREFSNSLARPAFSQELTYDLSESKTIVFRKTKIKLNEASNSSITFIILESPMCQKTSGTKIGECTPTGFGPIQPRD
jgi:hypothetical protein